MSELLLLKLHLVVPYLVKLVHFVESRQLVTLSAELVDQSFLVLHNAVQVHVLTFENVLDLLVSSHLHPYGLSLLQRTVSMFNQSSDCKAGLSELFVHKQLRDFVFCRCALVFLNRQNHSFTFR